jgi:hypothetical protein
MKRILEGSRREQIGEFVQKYQNETSLITLMKNKNVVFLPKI